MKSVLLLAAATVLLVGCNTIAYDTERFKPVSLQNRLGAEQIVDERARAIASDLGVTIESLFVQRTNGRTQRNDSNDVRQLTGFDAWMTIAECPQGNFVVSVDSFGVPTSAFTRFGCQVEGVPSF